MIIGPFALLPAQLAIASHASLEEWEQSAKIIFDMQKHVNWWLGDMVLYGEARFGDDFWQVPPLDSSGSLLERCAGVARKLTPDTRFKSLSWSHHVASLRVQHPALRQALLRRAENEAIGSEDFSRLVKETLE